MRKILIYIVVVMFLSLVFTSLSLANENKSKDVMQTRFYSGCYIEAEGKISIDDWFAIIRMPNMWKTFWFRPFKNEMQAFVSFWRLVFQSDSDVTIYSDENGHIQWDHQGGQEVHLIIVGFWGEYVPTSIDGFLNVQINGNALFAKPKLI